MNCGVSTLATKLHPPGRMRDRLRELLSQHGRLSVPVEQLGDRSDLYQAGLTSLATVGLMLAEVIVGHTARLSRGAD